MIDMKRQPRQKTPAEQELDRAMDEYETHFGRPYVFQIGGEALSHEETLVAIAQCIATNTPQELMRYEPKNVY